MYLSKKSTFIVLIISMFGLTSCGRIFLAFTHETPTIKEQDGKATVNGVLGKTFHKKMVKFIKANPNVKDLVLENIPGSINDEWNVKTCMLIHDNCMNTILKKDSEIASGGVDLFISGNNRIITDGAKIGVHSWRDFKKNGSEYPVESEEHDIFIDFFSNIDIDTSFYWYTLNAAPGDSIHWMTDTEILNYGLRNEIDSTHNCFNQ